MRVLVTETAHRRFWSMIARPGIEPLVMAADGSVSVPGHDGSRIHGTDLEVAWGTSDLFAPGAPAPHFLELAGRTDSLRWFQSPAAGYDDPFFWGLAERGVRVTTAHVNGIPIAEFVLRSVLDHFQRAPLWRQAQAGRRWEPHDYREIHGTTWLVIGLGSIGAGVARRAAVFGATVIGCRRRPQPSDPTARTVTPDGLHEVVGEADVIVLAVPASDETAKLVNRPFLERMKPSSVLVNVARGSLVDEQELLAALGRGRPEAAILDVFAVEPLPAEHPFWDHPRVTVTPHNSAGGVGRYLRQAELFAANLERYLRGEPLENDATATILASGPVGHGTSLFPK